MACYGGLHFPTWYCRAPILLAVVNLSAEPCLFYGFLYSRKPMKMFIHARTLSQVLVKDAMVVESLRNEWVVLMG